MVYSKSLQAIVLSTLFLFAADACATSNCSGVVVCTKSGQSTCYPKGYILGNGTGYAIDPNSNNCGVSGAQDCLNPFYVNGKMVGYVNSDNPTESSIVYGNQNGTNPLGTYDANAGTYTAGKLNYSLPGISAYTPKSTNVTTRTVKAPHQDKAGTTTPTATHQDTSDATATATTTDTAPSVDTSYLTGGKDSIAPGTKFRVDNGQTCNAATCGAANGDPALIDKSNNSIAGYVHTDPKTGDETLNDATGTKIASLDQNDVPTYVDGKESINGTSDPTASGYSEDPNVIPGKIALVDDTTGKVVGTEDTANQGPNGVPIVDKGNSVGTFNFNTGQLTGPDGKTIAAGGNNTPGGPGTLPVSGQSTQPVDSGALASADRKAEAEGAKDGKADYSDAKGGSSDACPTSAGINGKYGCDDTNNMIKTAQLTSQLGQQLGAMGVNTYGASAQTQASQNSNGNASTSYQAAAKTMEIGAAANAVVALGNIAAGAMELMAGSKHSDNGKQMTGASNAGVTFTKSQSSDFSGDTSQRTENATLDEEGESNQIVKAIIENGVLSGGKKFDGGLDSTSISSTVDNPDAIDLAFGPGKLQGILDNFNNPKYGRKKTLADLSNAGKLACIPTAIQNGTCAAGQQAMQQLSQRLAAENAKMKSITNTTASTAKAAADEQGKEASTANSAGTQSLIQGVLMAGSAFLQYENAKQMAQLANNIQGTQNGFVLANGMQNPGVNQQGMGATAVNPGMGGADPSITAPTNPPGTMANNGNLPIPMDPGAGGGGGGPSGPAAGGFSAPSGTGSEAGGSGGAGVTGLSSSPAKDESQPPAARMPATADRLSSYSGGGYTGGGGAGAADKGPDLSFLANLLPKAEDKNQPQNILEYGAGGNRSPAGMQPYSFLDRNVNIFQRISARTTMEFKRGNLGQIGGI